jgi:hypothetical protein
MRKVCSLLRAAASPTGGRGVGSLMRTDGSLGRIPNGSLRRMDGSLPRIGS